MKSPTTGKEMLLKTEFATIKYKGEEIYYKHISYYDEDTKQSFTTTELDEENLKEVKKKYNQLLLIKEMMRQDELDNLY